MSDRLDQIMFYVEQLKIQVSEEDLISDLEGIADAINDTFWDEMYREDNYDLAVENAKDMFDDEFEELSYIEERRENEEGWDESDDFEAFHDLVMEEVLERADVPDDEVDAQERMEESGDNDDDFDEEENM